MTTTMFAEAEPVEMDTVPPTEDVEYPCRVCGREAGPYSGRGPKPRLCDEHKKAPRKASGNTPRVTGKEANLAAQATQVLVQLNGMAAIGLMAVGFNQTASALAGANDLFEQQAYQALLTDPALCALIMKGGVRSGKVSLAIAYVGLGTAVVPTAVMEAKAKRQERDERLAAENPDTP